MTQTENTVPENNAPAKRALTRNKANAKKVLKKDSLTFSMIGLRLLQYKYWFVASLIVALVCAYYYILYTPNTYSRMATIMIKDETKGFNLEQSKTFKEIVTTGTNSVENQLGILKSKRLMRIVAERLKLNVSYKLDDTKKTELYKDSPIFLEYEGNKDSVSMAFTIKILDEKTLSLTQKDTEWNIKIPIGAIYRTNKWGRLLFTWNPKVTPQDEIGKVIHINVGTIEGTAGAYSGAVSAELINKKAALVTLSITDNSTRRAEDVLNNLIDVFSQDGINDKALLNDNSREFIKARLAVVERELDSLDNAIEKFKKDHDLNTVESATAMLQTRRTNYDNERKALDTQLDLVEYLLKYIRASRDNTRMIPANIGITDASILSHINEYNALIARKIQLISNSSEVNPLVLDLDNGLKVRRDALINTILTLKSSLQMQVDTLAARDKKNLARLTTIPELQRQLMYIERQQKIKEELYLYLLNKRDENELQQITIESICKVVDFADGSNAPVAPNKKQIYGIFCGIGLGLPLILFYLLIILDTKVHSIEDIKNKLTASFLGELPLDRIKEDRDILTGGNKHTSIQEAIRSVRESMNFMLKGSKDRCRTVQFFSMSPSSGKTFVCINVAFSLAFSGKKVILLDLDLRKGSLSSRLNLKDRLLGISNYLVDEEVELGNIIQHVQAPTCTFDAIAAGTVPPNPTEILRDKRLDDMLSILKMMYDYIIIDNPPYDMVVDALVCSRFCDLSVYIIRADKFDKRLLPDVQDLLDSQKFKNMSVLINAVDFKKMQNRFRYSPSYRYEYVPGKKKNRRRKKPLSVRIFNFLFGGGDNR
ncbi:MAG: polysaccharide biosynthesis tyrosine autokinase [Bacteroidaceae bacterium]|nr:polysaccharide biosynthesis tyrosine autokinase [Bacteroidaceae bacterium]